MSHVDGGTLRQEACHSSPLVSSRYSRSYQCHPGESGPEERDVQQVHVYASATAAANASAPGLARTNHPIISARDVVKRYGETVAVAGLDLTIWPGEIFGILGPNGAGKTTTLEMLEGLRAPDSGEMRVAGFDPVVEPERVHGVIGVQLQSTALFDYLNCAEIIALFAALYGADASPPRVERLLEQVGLEEKRRSRINTLSGGQQQRLAIALALVNTPRIAFLDEPTTGLDPAARRTLWQTIRDIRADETTVVLTTHYMEEAEQLCDRIAIMDRGRVVACDTPRALIEQLGADATVRASVQNGRIAGDDLQGLDGVVAAELRDRDGQQSFDLRSTDAQMTLTALLHLAQRQHLTLSGLSTSQASLEDVFLARTGHRYEGDS